jgi:hypothetical protein
MNYQKQAKDFCKKNNVKITFIGEVDFKKHFADEKQERYISKVRISRNGKSMIVNFGHSLQRGSDRPTPYDILNCLQRYEVGSFEEFCREFGYSDDSITALKIYKAVCKEYEGVLRVFDDIIEELQEII